MCPAALGAHEVPARVAVRAFVKADAARLHVLVRVPLEAMRDLDLRLTPDGYLLPDGLDAELHKAAQLWIAGYLELYEDGRRLDAPEIRAVRVALPADAGFTSYAAATAHLAAPSALPVDLHWQHAVLDVWLAYPIASPTAGFAIRPALAHLGLQTTTVLRFVTASGTERAYQYTGDPGLVRLEPRWYHAALGFTRLGFTHILGGIDHLLFLLCLVLPFRRVRPLIGVVTSFTLAHSITLAAAALGFAPRALWFPPLVEALIAFSILLMALENVVGPKLERRWAVAFVFGLVHGFGFSFALAESLQFAGGHLVTSLFAFNIGVELGQILLLLIAVPLLGAFFRHVVAERMGIIIACAFIAHTSWHWLADRAAALRGYRVGWPALDLLFLAAMLRALMLALIAGAAMWLMWRLAIRLGQQPARERIEA